MFVPIKPRCGLCLEENPIEDLSEVYILDEGHFCGRCTDLIADTHTFVLAIDLSSTNIGLAYGIRVETPAYNKYRYFDVVYSSVKLGKWDENDYKPNLHKLKTGIDKISDGGVISELIIEVSDIINPKLTNRHHTILGWIQNEYDYDWDVPIKIITPQEWRKNTYEPCWNNWRGMERAELKQLAITLCNNWMYKPANDDEAEAILILLSSDKCRPRQSVIETNLSSKRANRELQKKKKHARERIKKLEEKKKTRKLTVKEEAKYFQLKQLMKETNK